uniref:HTH luxR-type domain-containing protein n=1 Tax=Caenorhabditis japonica TaxID=281687 RepID=A0A8R1ETV0_CAEJA
MKSSPHRPSIELLFKRGLGSAEIARRLQISSSTVRNVVAAIKKRGDASEVKKSGRPRSVNTRNTRAIIKKRIIRNDGLSLNRMASQLGIARSTVQSIVKNDLKLKSYKLRRGQYLSDKSKAMRLEKCRKLLQHFQVRRVSDVIWTDEKIFTIEPLPNRQNQRQLLSKDDSMSPKRRLAHNRLFPKSVMVWAGITATAMVRPFGKNFHCGRPKKHRELGAHPKILATQFGCSSSQIYRILKNNRDDDGVVHRQSPGRPRTTSRTMDRNTLRACREDPRRTSTDIQISVTSPNEPVPSRRTIRRLCNLLDCMDEDQSKNHSLV